MTLAICGLLWHAFPITAMFLLAPYGKKWEGFYISLLLGPLGLCIVLLMRSELEEQRKSQIANP